MKTFVDYDMVVVDNNSNPPVHAYRDWYCSMANGPCDDMYNSSYQPKHVCQSCKHSFTNVGDLVD